MKPAVLAAWCGALLIAAGCGSNDTADRSRAAGDARPAAAPPPPAATSAPISPRSRIVVLGDSLTAGLGLEPGEAYPALLQERLDSAGLSYEVVNAGVSGDTSAGGLRRVDWALEGDVRIMILALGANDGLRGLPTQELAQNLGRIIERAQSRGVAVILAGMEAPPNFGQSYVDAFRQVYPDIARKYRVTLVPFLLDRVAGVSALNQADGIHPTAAGARIVADTLWAVLKPMADAKAGA